MEWNNIILVDPTKEKGGGRGGGASKRKNLPKTDEFVRSIPSARVKKKKSCDWMMDFVFFSLGGGGPYRILLPPLGILVSHWSGYVPISRKGEGKEEKDKCLRIFPIANIYIH